MDKNTINDIANKLQDIKNETIEEEQEQLEEGSEIHQSDIQPSDKKRIKELEKLFTATFEQFNEGGHGSIVDLNFKNQWGGGNRIMVDEWSAINKAIKKLKIRWIQVYNARVSVGLVSINEYDY